jgi:hypothetical protein
MIELDRKQRLAACQAAIAAALAHHRCELAAVPALAPDGRIVANVVLQVHDGN